MERDRPMAVDPNDIRGMKAARQEFSRRGIDVSRADVAVRGGVCTIRGLVGRMTGSDPNLMAEVQQAAKAIRQRSEIKDVVMEVSGNLL